MITRQKQGKQVLQSFPQLRRSVLAGFLGLGACNFHKPSMRQTEVLLFSGTGCSRGSVMAWRKLLISERLPFQIVDSDALNAMPEAILMRFRLLLIPGGNFEIMGKALTPEATQRIYRCVYNGLNYLGVCAGAFLGGASPYNGINLTNGIHFPFYGLEDQGIRKAPVPIKLKDGAVQEHYWEDGPQLSGWGEPLAYYPDGTPAIVSARVGKGLVLFSGIHPEADLNWRHGMKFVTSVAETQNFATSILRLAYGVRTDG